MKIEPMTSHSGKPVQNQFIIFTQEATFFQSYQTIIAKNTVEGRKRVTYLDEKYWNYSRTTSRYLAAFLGEPIKTVREHVKSGKYRLTDLNSD